MEWVFSFGITTGTCLPRSREGSAPNKPVRVCISTLLSRSARVGLSTTAPIARTEGKAQAVRTSTSSRQRAWFGTSESPFQPVDTVYIALRGSIKQVGTDDKGLEQSDRAEVHEDIWYSTSIGCIVKYRSQRWWVGALTSDYRKDLKAWFRRSR